MAKLKKNKKTNDNKKTKILLLIIALLAAIAITVFILITFISNPVEQNRQSAKTAMEAAVNEFSLPGELVEENITDKGCEENTTGLATHFDCRIVAQKIFKAPKSPTLEQQIKEAISTGTQWNHIRGNSYSSRVGDYTATMVFHFGSDRQLMKSLDHYDIKNDEIAYMGEFTLIYYSD